MDYFAGLDVSVLAPSVGPGIKFVVPDPVYS